MRLLCGAAGAGGDSGASGTAWFGAPGGFGDQGAQAVKGVVAILVLGAVAASFDDQDSVGSDTIASQLQKPFLDIIWQIGAVAHIEAQLHSGGDFVDILSTGSGGADEVVVQLAFVELNGGRDFDHAPSITGLVAGRELLAE